MLALAASAVLVPTQAVAATTAPTVTVMVIGDASGVLPTLDALESGAKAAEKAIEKTKTVQFDLEICDSQGNPSTAAACVSKAIGDKVDAVIAFTIVQGSALLPALEDAGIPTFWAATGLANEASSTISMIPTGATSVGYLGLGAAPALMHLTPGVFTVTPVTTALAKLSTQAYEAQGGKLAGVGTVEVPLVLPGSSTPPDLAPQAASLVANKPGVVVLGSATVEFVHVLREAGFNGPLVLSEGLTTADLDDALQALPPEQTKQLLKVGATPPLDTSTPLPAVKQYLKELKAVGVTDVSTVQAFSWQSWIAMYALAKVVPDMKTVDATSLLTKLNSSTAITLPTGAVWNPTAKGLPGFEREGGGVAYVSRYVGHGKWKAVKPFGAKGLAVDASTLKG